MKLIRVHAYAVEPERTMGAASKPVGGAVTVSAEIEQALGQAAMRDFHDRRSRSHVRLPD